MALYRIGPFLVMAVFILTAGSATAGFDEGVAAYERGDYAAALREFMPLALGGDSSAQYSLGVMYTQGEGIAQDYAEAVRWYRLAADQGNASAQYNLGVRYHDGEGVPQNYAEAARWFRLAADQGLAQAQFALGLMYDRGQGLPQNYSEAVRWYRTAAAQGNANAQSNLGAMYALGQGVPQSYADAMRWFHMAADQGYADAQFNLGVMYHRGQGVPRSYAEAVRWYHMAAVQGEAKAEHNLGIMYVRGQGVPQDYVLAYVWFNVAAARSPQQEGELSSEMRDKIAAQLAPAQLARAQEMARNWRPESQPVPQVGPPPRILTDGEVFGRSVALQGVQAKLAALGYDSGPVDGVMGPRTRAAIWAFEAVAGLPVDGQVSDRLIAALSNAGGADGGSAAAQTAAADTGSEGMGAKPWERYAEQRRLDGTGTGFAVGQDGQIVTNHHVVADCAEVRVRPAGQEAVAGEVIARDRGNDLALLRSPARLPAAILRSGGGIRAGDSVVAVGFPLPGLLAAEANVTTGIVSALAGIGNDPRFLQMTVPVQPGNSGSPLLDLEGRVVGIVVGKLDALKVASVTGDIPQNVNFAIKADVVRSFLNSIEMAPRARARPPADATYPMTLSPAAVGAEAKTFTVLVECWKLAIRNIQALPWVMAR